jgi:hypothetical protein
MADFTLDSTLGQVLADPQAKAIMDQYVPGVSSNPMVAMVQGVSLRALVSMPQAQQMGFTQEKVQTILDQINKAV